MSNEGLNMYQTEKETQYSVPAQARKLELEKKILLHTLKSWLYKLFVRITNMIY